VRLSERVDAALVSCDTTLEAQRMLGTWILRCDSRDCAAAEPGDWSCDPGDLMLTLLCDSVT